LIRFGSFDGWRRVFESNTSEGGLLRNRGDMSLPFVAVGFLQAGFLSLIFLVAPAALGGRFCTSFFDNFFPQFAVGLLRGHVVDA
jgi:hypothetical protein